MSDFDEADNDCGLDFDEADKMCPNCVTPWKCNGPHLTQETVAAKRTSGSTTMSDAFRQVGLLQECQEARAAADAELLATSVRLAVVRLTAESDRQLRLAAVKEANAQIAALRRNEHG